MSEAKWSKEFPKVEGVYWARRTQTNRSEPQAIRVWDYEGDWYAYRFGDGRDIEADDFIKSMYEYLGPVTPADVEQLIDLRAESLKGICVYCGEIQQYESLEHKSGEGGNRIRVEHIKKCPQRPELKLIAYCEELQRAASAAIKVLKLEFPGSLKRKEAIARLEAALNPKN